MRQYGDKETQPVINAVRDNIEAYFSTEAFTDAFFDGVFDLNTAKGFGLDIWGRILAKDRYLNLDAAENLGFDEGDQADDWYPFDDGTWYNGESVGTNYRLSDEAYRVILLMKAFANIAQTTIPNMNRILMEIFGDRGHVYVVDLGDMAIKVVFNFPLSQYEKAVIESGVFPHPGGVEITMQYVSKQYFGFEGTQLQPFNQAPFLG